MKQSIKWHEECLVSMTRFAEDATEGADLAIRKEKDAWGSVRLLQDQISEAKRKGKDGFDSERFMVKKS